MRKQFNWLIRNSSGSVPPPGKTQDFHFPPQKIVGRNWPNNGHSGKSWFLQEITLWYWRKATNDLYKKGGRLGLGLLRGQDIFLFQMNIFKLPIIPIIRVNQWRQFQAVLTLSGSHSGKRCMKQTNRQLKTRSAHRMSILGNVIQPSPTEIPTVEGRKFSQYCAPAFYLNNFPFKINS